MANLSQAIPYAINTQTKRRIKPEEASAGTCKGHYECHVPDCRKPVFLSISKYGRAHFKHYPEDDISTIPGNHHPKSQDIHTRAKLLIKDIFLNGLAKRAPMPRLIFETPHGIEKILPFLTNCSVKNEFNLGTSNRKIDLAIIDNEGIPVLLLEVNHKHPLDIAKIQDLKQYWWIEVDAKDVLQDPTNLIVRRHCNFPYEIELLGVQNILFN